MHALLTSLENLFIIQPTTTWNLMWWYVGFVGLSLIVAIVPLFLKKWLHETVIRRLITWGWTQVLLGAFLFFCRYNQLPYVGMDFLRTLQELTAYIWIIFIILYAVKHVPTLRIAQKAKERRQKYLPQQK